MQRKLLDALFKDIHNNFEAARATSVTFRGFDIEELTGAGLSIPQANELYDGQMKLITLLLKKLSQFPEKTPEELAPADVNAALSRLIEEMCLAVVVTEADKELEKKLINAWDKTTMRGANIAHALRASSLYIKNFIKLNNILPELKNYLETNGFAGFLASPKAKPQVAVANTPSSQLRP